MTCDCTLERAQHRGAKGKLPESRYTVGVFAKEFADCVFALQQAQSRDLAVIKPGKGKIRLRRISCTLTAGTQLALPMADVVGRVKSSNYLKLPMDQPIHIIHTIIRAIIRGLN